MMQKRDNGWQGYLAAVVLGAVLAILAAASGWLPRRRHNRPDPCRQLLRQRGPRSRTR